MVILIFIGVVDDMFEIFVVKIMINGNKLKYVIW